VSIYEDEQGGGPPTAVVSVGFKSAAILPSMVVAIGG
jgi:hypothetical protein